MGCFESTELIEDDPMILAIQNHEWDQALALIGSEEYQLALRSVGGVSSIFIALCECDGTDPALSLIGALIPLSGSTIAEPIPMNYAKWKETSTCIEVAAGILPASILSKVVLSAQWKRLDTRYAIVQSIESERFDNTKVIIDLLDMPLNVLLIYAYDKVPVTELSFLVERISIERDKNRLNTGIDRNIDCVAGTWSVGSTALLVATQGYVDELVYTMIDCGADWTIRNEDGYNALEVALGNENIEVARYMIQKTNTCTKKHTLSTAILKGHSCNLCKRSPKRETFSRCQICDFDVCSNCMKPVNGNAKGADGNAKGAVRRRSSEVIQTIKPAAKEALVNANKTQLPAAISSKQRKTIMLSYNIRTTSKLAKALKSLFDDNSDYSAWVCEIDLKPGQDWRTTIGKMVMMCDVFVMLVNPEWVTSGECNDEYNMAKSRNVKTGRPLMIPIFLEYHALDSTDTKIFSLTANYNVVSVKEEIVDAKFIFDQLKEVL
jgi:hypothetical protein